MIRVECYQWRNEAIVDLATKNFYGSFYEKAKKMVVSFFKTFYAYAGPQKSRGFNSPCFLCDNSRLSINSKKTFSQIICKTINKYVIYYVCALI